MTHSLEYLPMHYSALNQSFKTIATTYYYNGLLDDAIRVMKQAVSISKQNNLSRGQHVDLLLTYGDLLMRQAGVATGNFDAALKIAGLALEKADTALLEGKALNLLGSIYYQQSLNSAEQDFMKPREYFQRSYDMLKGEGDPQALFWPVLRIGLTHQFMNEMALALDYFRQAEQLARENGLELELSFAIRHVGFVLQSQADYSEALTAQQESLQLREKLGFKIFLSMAYVAVASVYDDLGQEAEVLAHYEKALAVAHDVNLARPLFITLVNYGIALQTASQYEEAHDKLYKARKYAEEIGHQRGLSIIAEKLAEMNEVLQ